MARQSESMTAAGQPTLNELLTQYLQHADFQAAPSGAALVEPYDAATRQPVDTRLAWRCAQAGLAVNNVTSGSEAMAAPDEWATLVQQQDSTPAVAFAAGNYPQLLRDLPALVQAAKLAHLVNSQGPAIELPGLSTWAETQAAGSLSSRLLAAGVLRLAGQFDQAGTLLAVKGRLSSSEQERLHNEHAALAWHRGNLDEAIKGWSALAAGSHQAQFNRGMAALFTDEPAKAIPFLQAAVAQCTDDDPWGHLAGLYLALAEMRA